MRGAADSGVSGCATCSYEGAVKCTRCAVGYLGVDGTSCSNSCIGNTLGECSDITEQGGSSTVVSCSASASQAFTITLGHVPRAQSHALSVGTGIQPAANSAILVKSWSP